MSASARGGNQDSRRRGRDEARSGDTYRLSRRAVPTSKEADRQAPVRRYRPEQDEDDDDAEGTYRRRRERVEAREQTSEPLPRRILEGVVRHHRLLITLGIIVIVILSLYGPTQRYYVAWRTRGDQEAKAQAIDADNDALKQDIERLTSRKGIEDEARQRGYAYPSEGSSNTNTNTGDGNKGSDATDNGFSYSDIEQPWFIHVLDFIFVYNGPVD